MRAWLILCVAALLAGCSVGDAQQRFRVSGKVTFDGKPVPHGEVLFTPDGSQSNAGAQGIATIENGHYDTQGSRAPGVAGGPTVVRVTALSDPKGTLLFEHEFHVDLPQADTTHDIEISASEVKPPATTPEI